MITFGLSDLLFFAGILLLAYGLAFAGLVLPLVGLVTWLRGRHGRGLVIGAVGLGCLAIRAGPALWDRWQFHRTVQALQRAEVRRTIPDLTGKTVAYISNRSHDDPQLECRAILETSGAAAVLMIDPYRPSIEGGAPLLDLGAPLDLTALVTGRATIGSAPLGEADYWPDSDLPYCVPEPLKGPVPRIDYFVMQGGFEGAERPFEDMLERAGSDRVPARLGWYFGPVDNPSAFQPAPERADLLSFSLWQEIHGFLAFGFGVTFAQWPPTSADDPDVLAALCREGAADCRVNCLMIFLLYSVSH